MDKLTKAQKALLLMMRETGAYIERWNSSIHYALYDREGNRIRSILYNWMLGTALRPFFTEQYQKGQNRTHYRLRPDAEITDEWRAAELERQAQAKRDAEIAKQAKKANEDAIASDYFNDADDGRYQIRFDGQWPFEGEILFNGEPVASIRAYHVDSQDSFADMLKRPGNVEHFAAIKAMIRAANCNERLVVALRAFTDAHKAATDNDCDTTKRLVDAEENARALLAELGDDQ